MRKKLIYSIVFISMITTWSCKKSFIETPQNAVSDLDNYFTNYSECQAFVDGLYKGFATWEDWWQQYQRLTNEMATDDAWMGNLNQDASGNYPFAFYTITAGNAPSALQNFYTYKYLNISTANIALQRLANAPITVDERNKLSGQAKFFRAFSYWELVQNFGDVVLYLEPMGTTELNKSRSPKADVYTAIIKDLKEAASMLPASWDDANVGRVTKGACQALLARTYLFTMDYQNSYAYADTVIKSNYHLEQNFVNIWSVYNHNGSESIFEIQTNANQTYSVGSRFPVVVNARGEIWSSTETNKAMDGWGWCVPTSNLEQAFKSEGDSIRLKSTIIRLGLPVYGDSANNPHYSFNPDLNKSCRTWRKMYVPIDMRKSLVAKDSHIPLDLILLRLGEMYLTRAEDAYFLKKSDVALADMKTIRDRVGLAEKKNLIGSDLLYAIWKERRLELADEGLRLYDLRREIDPIANKPMIDMVMGSNGSFVKYNATSTDYWENMHPGEQSSKGSYFIEGKHELWPIPQSEIDRSNGTLSQNPGY